MRVAVVVAHLLAELKVALVEHGQVEDRLQHRAERAEDQRVGELHGVVDGLALDAARPELRLDR